MTTKETFKAIISRRGWYQDIDIPVNTAKSLAKRFRENQLSLDKIEEIIQKAGYTVKQEKLWDPPQAPEE